MLCIQLHLRSWICQDEIFQRWKSFDNVIIKLAIAEINNKKPNKILDVWLSNKRMMAFWNKIISKQKTKFIFLRVKSPIHKKCSINNGKNIVLVLKFQGLSNKICPKKFGQIQEVFQDSGVSLDTLEYI